MSETSRMSAMAPPDPPGAEQATNEEWEMERCAPVVAKMAPPRPDGATAEENDEWVTDSVEPKSET